LKDPSIMRQFSETRRKIPPDLRLIGPWPGTREQKKKFAQFRRGAPSIETPEKRGKEKKPRQDGTPCTLPSPKKKKKKEK